MSDAIDIEARCQWIRTRRLEIAADLAERKRRFFVDGVAAPMSERCTLEAEDAALALELRRISAAAVQAKTERARKLRVDTLAQLERLLSERGMLDVVDEAKELAARECA